VPIIGTALSLINERMYMLRSLIYFRKGGNDDEK
jgi:hypothetical protein